LGRSKPSEQIEAGNEASTRSSSLTHWVILLKEETAEVVAQSLEITRE
jgi:hypothetical protein